MEDSFKVRVDKLFGEHLFKSVPNSSFPTTSWCVTDGEVEKREWNRERGVDEEREEIPCASAYDEVGDGCFGKTNRERRRRNRKKKSLEEDEMDDEEEDDEETEGDAGLREDEKEEEERGIRASVGLDPTLDREEEEDEYDMAAVFKERRNDRVYLSDISDCAPYINYHSVVHEDSNEVIHKFEKDPRADHLAANARISEDKEVGDTIHTVTGHYDMLMVDSLSRTTKAEVDLKSILKRKENHEDLRPKKHVRFNPSSGDNSNDRPKHSPEVVEARTVCSATTPEPSSTPDNSPGIPDYVRNPSKYTCYSFDTSDDMDNKSNLRAFTDFQNMVKRAESTELVAGSMELPKSVSFAPRKKATDAMKMDEKPTTRNEDFNKVISESEVASSIQITVGDAQESEVCAMEEDNVVEAKQGGSRRAGRKYRSRSSADDSAFQDNQ